MRVRKPECIAHADHAADAGAEADRHIDGIEIGDRAEKFVGVGRDPDDEVAVEGRHELVAAIAREGRGLLLRLVEIAAVLDQFGAEAAHRRVLLRGIAVRHHDGDAAGRRGAPAQASDWP